MQTAILLAIMLIAMPAGAIADMRYRLVVGLIALSIELSGATALTAFDSSGLTTPNLLLAFCFIAGSGMALMGPAWQSPVSQQVPISREALGPRLVALSLRRREQWQRPSLALPTPTS